MRKIDELISQKVLLMKRTVEAMDDITLEKVSKAKTHDGIDLFSNMAKCEIAKRKSVIEEWEVQVNNKSFVIRFKSDMEQDEAIRVVLG